jgi:predicted RNA-binding Zn-ribbon protein involved in translation (DUF1610 family)
MRLIDADELLKEYDEEHEGPPGRARELIENAPTIGHYGKWKVLTEHRITSTLVRCSVCNSTVAVFEDDFMKFKYCPNCGIKMEQYIREN